MLHNPKTRRIVGILSLTLTIAVISQLVLRGNFGDFRGALITPAWVSSYSGIQGDIVINEIGWSGTNSGANDQYLELRNMTNSSINFSTDPLEIWKNGALLLTINTGNIAANDFFVITRLSLGSSSLTSSDLVTASLILDPSAVQYQIKDQNTTNILDTADDGVGVVFDGDSSTGNHFSMERDIQPYKEPTSASTDGQNPEYWHTAYKTHNFNTQLSNTKGTPGAYNSVATGDLIINEINWVGNPKNNDDDWVELRNMTNQDLRDLVGDITLAFDFLSNGNTISITDIASTAQLGTYFPPHGIYIWSKYASNRSYITPSSKTLNFTLGDADLQVALDVEVDSGQSYSGLVIMDKADDGVGTPMAGNSNLFASMERNLIPYSSPDNAAIDGQSSSYWHTASQSTNLENSPNATPLATPGSQNSAEFLINEINWMGSTASPTDYFIEFKKIDSESAWPDGSSNMGTLKFQEKPSSSWINIFDVGSVSSNKDFLVTSHEAIGSINSVIDTPPSNCEGAGHILTPPVLSSFNANQFRILWATPYGDYEIDHAGPWAGTPFSGSSSSGTRITMERNRIPMSGISSNHWSSAIDQRGYQTGTSSLNHGTPCYENSLSSGDLVMNEVMWGGTNDISPFNAEDWIELRNMTSTNIVNLPGNSFEIAIDNPGASILVNSLSFTPGEFKIVRNDTPQSLLSQSDLADPSFNLSDSVNQITLFFSTPYGNANIDSANNSGDPWFFGSNTPGNFKSMERNIIPYSSPFQGYTEGNLDSFWQDALWSKGFTNYSGVNPPAPGITPLGTPGFNSSTTQPPDITQFVISGETSTTLVPLNSGLGKINANFDTNGNLATDLYEIELSTNGSPFVSVTNIPITFTSFPVASFTQGSLDDLTTYQYKIRVIDGFGSASNFVLSNTITTPDRTAPVVSTIPPLIATSATFSNIFSFNTNEIGYLGSGLYTGGCTGSGGPVGIGNFTTTITVPNAGSYTCVIPVFDSTGNFVNHPITTFNVVSPPAITLDSVIPASPTNSNFTITFTLTGGLGISDPDTLVTFTSNLSGTLNLISGTNGASPLQYTYSPNSIPSSGAYSYVIYGEDTAGNSATYNGSIIVDTIAPITTLNSGPSALNNSTPSLNFTISDNLSGTGNVSVSSPCSITSSIYALPGTYNLNLAIPDGSYSGCQLQVTDLAGNMTSINVLSPINTFVIDTVTPTVSTLDITSTNPTSTLATTGNTVTVNFTASENLLTSPTISIPNFGVVNASMTGSNTTWSYTRMLTGTESVGLVNFTINFSDPSGNTNTANNSNINGTNGSVTVGYSTPVATISYSPNQLTRNGISLTITADLGPDEPLTNPPFITITQPGGPTIPEIAMTDISTPGHFLYEYTYVVNAGSSGNGGVALTNGAGNPLKDILSTNFNLTNTVFNVDNGLPVLNHVTTLPRIFSSNPFNYTFNFSDNMDTIGNISLSGGCTTTTSQTNFSNLNSPTPTTLQISVLTDGVYACTLTTTDDAGNASNLTLNFTVDTTPPTLTPGLTNIISNYSNTALATNAHILTLSFNTSEPILPPSITFFGGALPNTGSILDLGGQISWEAKYTITGSETEGYVPFTISFQDLALIPAPTTYTQTSLSGNSVIYDRTAPIVSNFSITNRLTSPWGEFFMDNSSAPNNGIFALQADIEDLGPLPNTPTSGVNASSINLLFEFSDGQGYQTPTIPVTFTLQSGNTYQGTLNLNTNPLLSSDDYNINITVADNVEKTYDENSLGFNPISNSIIDYLSPERSQSFTGFTTTPPGAAIIGKNSAYLPGVGAILAGFLYPKDDIHYETFDAPPPSGIGVRNHSGFPDGIHHYEISFQQITPVPGSVETLPIIYSNPTSTPTGVSFLLNEYPLGSGVPLSDGEQYNITIKVVDVVGHQSITAIDSLTATPNGPNHYIIPPQISPYNMTGSVDQLTISFSEPLTLTGEDRNRYEIFVRPQNVPTYGAPVLSPAHGNLLGFRTFNVPGTANLTYCSKARAVNVYPLGSIAPLDLSLYGPYSGEPCRLISTASGSSGTNSGDTGGSGGGGGGGHTVNQFIQNQIDAINSKIGDCPYNFVDVPTNHRYRSQILRVCALNIMQGLRSKEETQLYYPDNNLFRSELAKVLLVGIKKLQIDFRTYFGVVPVFSDVDPRIWENGATFVAKNMKIMNGYENGAFGIHDVALHMEVIKALIDTAGLPINDLPQYTPLFTDISGLVPWQQKYLNAAIHHNIIANTSDKLNVQMPISRGKIADYILKTLDAVEVYKLSEKQYN